MRIADFTGLFGAEIVGVAVEERVDRLAGSVDDRALISIWLRLGHGHDVTLHGAGSGTGVVARSEPPERVELGGGSAHLEITDAEGRYGLVPGRVERVWEVWARGVSVGVRWALADGTGLTVCFAGDEWSIGGPAEMAAWSLEEAGPLTYTALYDEQAAT